MGMRDHHARSIFKLNLDLKPTTKLVHGGKRAVQQPREARLRHRERHFRAIVVAAAMAFTGIVVVAIVLSAIITAAAMIVIPIVMTASTAVIVTTASATAVIVAATAATGTTVAAAAAAARTAATAVIAATTGKRSRREMVRAERLNCWER